VIRWLSLVWQRSRTAWVFLRWTLYLQRFGGLP